MPFAVNMAHSSDTRSSRNRRDHLAQLGAVLLVTTALVAGSAHAQKPKPKIKSTLDEWVELFNGDDFDGWTSHYGDPDLPINAGWEIDRARLVAKGEPVGYLRSTNSFRDFVLELQWRVDPGAGQADSGVLLRVIGEGLWPQAIEVDLGSESAGDISGLNGYSAREASAGRSGSAAMFPTGSWNSTSIRVVDDVIQVTINGRSVNRAGGVAVEYGRVGLVSNGGRVEFRNVRIRPIDINRPGKKGRKERRRAGS